jgi:mutator protein MutT
MSTCEPQSIAVAVVRQAGRVLIAQRPPGAPLAGFWEFPGGKLRPGEDPQQAAVRECLEETGLAVRIDRLYGEVLHCYEHGTLRLFFYAAQPLEPAERPREPFVWVAISELSQYAFPPANEKLIVRLLQENAF